MIAAALAHFANFGMPPTSIKRPLSDTEIADPRYFLIERFIVPSALLTCVARLTEIIAAGRRHDD